MSKLSASKLETPATNSLELENDEKVLVVDDEIDARVIHSRYLLNAGVSPDNIISATNGAEALSILTKDTKKKIKLVMLDFKMPGVDGATVLREIRITRADVRVIVVSALKLSLSDPELEGAESFIQKPLRLNHALFSKREPAVVTD